MLYTGRTKPVTDYKSLMADDGIRLTVEQACAQAQQKASHFVATVGKGETYTYSKSIVESVDACRLMKGEDRVGLHVNLETPSQTPCDAPSRVISK
jgi:hypothetical protein